ncbi:hypothetical protein GIX45_28280 [Erwinia sp. CPCC 100877]|nr:hypothetical protein [Erwinia sp. CPCC 100877]
MVDIVQLRENGVPKYLRTHAKAIEGAEVAFVSKTANETVTGIKNFPDGLQIAGDPVTQTSLCYRTGPAGTTFDRAAGSEGNLNIGAESTFVGAGLSMSANDTVRVNIDGVYEINFTGWLQNFNGSMIIGTTLAGSTTAGINIYTAGKSSTDTPFCLQQVVAFKKGDTIQIKAKNSGTTVTKAQNVRWAIKRIA